MAKIESVLLKSKFKGSLLGSLLGDCLGGPFEGDIYSPGMKLTVKKYFDKLDGTYFNTPKKGYTDDTAMMKSVAMTLIDKPSVDYKHMAKLFTQEYFREPRRGYGAAVVQVFHILKKEKFEDIYGPAKLQFNGKGSYGNGGAMRVAPIPLFFHDNYEGMIEATKKSTELTHTHELGLNGALLQAIAIHLSLHLNPADGMDTKKFTSDLLEKIKELEGEETCTNPDDAIPYQTQLKYLIELLNVNNPEDPVVEEEIIGCLGNSVAAIHSVPTAIYCFLKAFQGFPGIETENVFRRAIQYAICLGGDTDTIASMTGAIAGAYFGVEGISKNMLQHCEYFHEMNDLADRLFEASHTCRSENVVNN